jgi:hypothetical protein
VNGGKVSGTSPGERGAAPLVSGQTTSPLSIARERMMAKARFCMEISYDVKYLSNACE